MITLHNKRGFTLVELLISIFLAMVVIGAGYTIFQGSNRASMQQNIENRMQDNARMAMDVIARAFRTAGFMVNFNNYPIGSQIGSSAYNASFYKIRPVNSSTGPDQVYMTAGSLISSAKLRNTALSGSNTLVLTSATGTVGSYIGIGLTHTAKISAVSGNTITLDTSVQTAKLNMSYPGTYLEDGTTLSNQQVTPIRLIVQTRFAIDSKSVLQQYRYENISTSFEPIAEDIENLQIAYGVDRNNNRIIEASEWTNSPATNEYDQIRLARITIVARAGQPHPDLIGKAITVPAIEDYPAKTYTDGRRRFVLTRIVKLRNLDVLFTL